MKKALVLVLALMLIAGAAFASGEAEEEGYEWQPDRPINLIVPWDAGGSTDRSARTTAGIVEEELGTSIVIVNQAGASGSVGTQEALNAEKDGLTWTAGAVKDLGVYKVQGLLDTTLDDWHLYLNVAMPNVVAVNPDTPYEDFGDLLDAFEENPGEIPVAT
ncbi:MAG: tripartite tricarboxylate transporter substrate-binding protein, partial [Spirochaetia bacterium]